MSLPAALLALQVAGLCLVIAGGVSLHRRVADGERVEHLPAATKVGVALTLAVMAAWAVWLLR